MPEDRHVTRDYLAEMEARLLVRLDAIGWRLAGLATVYTVVILGALFILPRLPR